MKFYDEAEITIQSWKWGDGLISWRREKGVPRWGPAGWDGGAWWSVYFQADLNEYTLLPLRYRRVRKAAHGGAGQSSDKYGAAGDDITLKVPLGTLIKEKWTGHALAHLTTHGQRVCLAKWWIGGKWNIHFKNSVNQYPNIALYGEPGERRDLSIELQLLGDIALIWTPSVGKSTLINSISNVKARTAAYEFTTLVPNLWIVDHKGKSFAMVDVPGLIEWASEGKGLGNMFLRHILKARAWVIMLDAAKDLPWISEWGLLVNEITNYVEEKYAYLLDSGDLDTIEHVLTSNKKVLRYQAHGISPDGEKQVLLTKAIVTVVNKYDMLDEELWEEYKVSLLEHMHTHTKEHGYEVSKKNLEKTTMALSALTKVHIDQFLDTCLTIVSDDEINSIATYDVGIEIVEAEKASCTNITEDELEYLIEEWYVVFIKDKSKKINVWEIYHPQIAYFTFVLPWGNDEAEMRYRQMMWSQWYMKRLELQWVKKWDVLKIRSPYIWTEDRYIMQD